MNDPITLTVVGLPALTTMLLILGRVLTRAVPQLSSRPAFGNEARSESAFEWAVHFSVGLMLLGILTVGGLGAVDRPHAVIGLFSGLLSAILAYFIARPPLRPDVKNPEIDLPLIAASSGVLALVGIAVASLLITYSDF